jgi:hypothetical protein
VETKVSQSTTESQYTAVSLGDIANFCEHLARNSRTLAEHSTLQRERRYHEGEAAGYQHLAGVLRRTELKPALRVKPSDLPDSVEEDLREYVEANPANFDGQPFSSQDQWDVKGAVDAYLRWNGVIGYTEGVMAIVLAAKVQS